MLICQAGVDLEDVVSATQSQSKSKRKEEKLRPKKRPPISKVLLVGGATRMPIFRQFVENLTGIAPDPSLVDPDLVSLKHREQPSTASIVACPAHLFPSQLS